MNNKYIDLHMHLDGAISVNIAKRLAEIQNIDLPTDDKELKRLLTVPEDCKSLTDFLKCFKLPCSLMQTSQGLEEAAYLVLEEAKEQGLIYTEIRWAPQLHTLKGLTQENAVKAVLRGVSRSSLKANVILCCMRGDDNRDANEITLETARQFLADDGGVVAIDLAGAEGVFNTVNFKYIFDKANKYQIPFTIHAGEADGAESVRTAIEYGAKRIGHGIRIKEDESVMKLARDNKICLEMCPTSNLKTCTIKTIYDYPVIEYLNYGLKVTVNTDDPAIEDTTLADEYNLLEANIGLSASDRLKLLNNAVDAAFTSDVVKAELRMLIGSCE